MNEVLPGASEAAGWNKDSPGDLYDHHEQEYRQEQLLMHKEMALPAFVWVGGQEIPIVWGVSHDCAGQQTPATEEHCGDHPREVSSTMLQIG